APAPARAARAAPAPQVFDRSVETAAAPLAARPVARERTPTQRPGQLAKAEPAAVTPTKPKPKPAPVSSSPAKTSSCKAEPTPADQTVWASTGVTAPDRQRRDAGGRAIGAG